MGIIVVDESEFIEAMKKLQISVVSSLEVLSLYSTSDVDPEKGKIKVVKLKYKQG